jgi:hypothetical protein
MRALTVMVATALVVDAAAVDSLSQTLRTDAVLRTCPPVVLYKDLNAQRYEPACVIALQHPIEGVVECALRDAMLMKIAQSDLDVPGIEAEIDRLTVEGASPTIRYKAVLAQQVYRNPKLFVSLTSADFFTAEEAFAGVARTLEEAYLAARQ